MESTMQKMNVASKTLVAALAVGTMMSAGTILARDYDMNHLSAGGIDPNIHVTSIAVGSQTTAVSWVGLQGPFQVEASTNGMVSWFTVSPLTNALVGCFRLANPGPIAANFRLVGPELQYISVANGCQACHPNTVNSWSYTPHASALRTLAAQSPNQATNTACLSCHTLGYGYSTGYNTTNTPWKGGVQCENCHGPAGGHAGSMFTPAVSQSPMVCGGCHTGTDQPQYDEWAGSAGRTYYHGRTGTNMHFASTYANTNIATSEGRMAQCGPCHSGRVQHDLVNAPAISAPTTSVIFPTTNQVLEAGIGCVTCHDPHNQHLENGGYHLRYPLYSTNAYEIPYMQFTNTYATIWGSNGVAFGASRATNFFLARTNHMTYYNPDVMLCGQCHRERIADTSMRLISSTHVSHQYGMNSATIGITTDTNSVPRPVLGTGSSQHGINTKGASCTLCHVPHEFHVETNGCYLSGCHDINVDSNMTEVIETAQASISNGMLAVREMLNYWSLSTNAPSSITNTHRNGGWPIANKTIKWEYQSVGTIGKWGVPSTVTNTGTSSAQQSLIPLAIREARYNLYLIRNDESMGVHNPDWARYLIAVASNKVAQQLGLPPETNAALHSAWQSSITPATASRIADGIDDTNVVAITLQVRNADGSNRSSGGDTVVFAKTSGTLSDQTDNGNGTYSVSWSSTSTVSGVAAVTATVNGFPVGALSSENYTLISLLPGPVDASHSTVSPLAATNSVASGTNRTITVQARDVYNNNRTSGGDTVVFNATAGTLGSTSNLNNGSYTVRWTVPANTNINPVIISATLGSVDVGTAVSASNSVIWLTP
jgi:predicted CXXCH cytochrome family protein